MRVNSSKDLSAIRNNLIVDLFPFDDQNVNLKSGIHNIHHVTRDSPLALAMIRDVGSTSVLKDKVTNDKSAVLINYGSGTFIDSMTDYPRAIYDREIMVYYKDYNHMKIKDAIPNKNRLILKVLSPKDTDVVGLEDLNDQYSLHKMNIGIVYSVGDEVEGNYKPGDILGYNEYAGEQVDNCDEPGFDHFRVIFETELLVKYNTIPEGF